MADLTISVAGMTCRTCEDSIQRALSLVEGIRAVRADHRSGRVEVRVDGAVTMDALRGAVEDAGYDLEEASTAGGS